MAYCLQVGRTQRWEVTGAASGVGSVNATIYDMQRYLEDCLSPTQNPGMMGAKPGDNVFSKSDLLLAMLLMLLLHGCLENTEHPSDSQQYIQVQAVQCCAV
jgi:hypothetical protein